MATFPIDEASQGDREFTFPEHVLSSLLLSVFPQSKEMLWWQQCRPEKRLLRGKAYRKAKRLMDLTIISVALVFVLPVLLFCALLIKLESPGGPVMFKQKRTGKGGHPFYIFKFRTMVPNAEAMKQELADLNELQWPDFKIANDPRITRVGRILRKTSLDEMPQLLNVLRGEMSLVGPRPTSFSAETYQLWHTERLDVMPGITGLWQILGRGSMEFDERVRLDVAYIERCSLWLDFQILLRTFTAVLVQRGAH